MVEVVEVEVEVVVDVAGGFTRLCSVVPVSAPPKIADKGWPEISSTAVINSSARTNTTAAVPAMAPQENRCGARGRPGPGCIGRVVARRRSVAGAPAAAEISRRSVSPADGAGDVILTVSAAPLPSGSGRPTTSVGAEDASATTRLRWRPCLPACATASRTRGPGPPPA